jgi:membrane protease YdiL (CAAX protease family)
MNTTFVGRRPLTSYFGVTFVISWSAAFAIVAPKLLHGEPIPKFSGILMFPAMLLGPAASGVLMTRLLDGPAGIRKLFSSIVRVRVGMRWYSILLLPPAAVLAVLLTLKTFVSPAFAPNHFLLGVAFGIPAGFLEEIGWTGFAFPRMQTRLGTLQAGVLLGLLWSAWHLPVIDFLGAASPHGKYLPLFFLSFATAMTAMRVLIGWIYQNTQSVLLAQFMHISSTGALVVFGPFQMTPAQETVWYFTYGVGLWIVVAALVAWFGRALCAADLSRKVRARQV